MCVQQPFTKVAHREATEDEGKTEEDNGEDGEDAEGDAGGGEVASCGGEEEGDKFVQRVGHSGEEDGSAKKRKEEESQRAGDAFEKV